MRADQRGALSTSWGAVIILAVALSATACAVTYSAASGKASGTGATHSPRPGTAARVTLTLAAGRQAHPGASNPRPPPPDHCGAVRPGNRHRGGRRRDRRAVPRAGGPGRPGRPGTRQMEPAPACRARARRAEAAEHQRRIPVKVARADELPRGTARHGEHRVWHERPVPARQPALCDRSAVVAGHGHRALIARAGLFLQLAQDVLAVIP